MTTTNPGLRRSISLMTVLAAILSCIGGRAACAAPMAATDLAAAAFGGPVETVMFSYVKTVSPFETEMTAAMAEEFELYINRKQPNRVRFILDVIEGTNAPSLRSDVLQIISPQTDMCGLKWCMENDMVPWVSTVVSETNCGIRSRSALARKGTIRRAADLLGKRWCIAGNMPEFDYYLVRRRLCEALPGVRLDQAITLVRIHATGPTYTEARRDALLKVLLDEADFTVVHDQEYAVFERYYPEASKKLEQVAFLSPRETLHDNVGLCRRNQVAQLMSFRDLLCDMQNDPEADEFLIAAGISRFVAVTNASAYYMLTNQLKHVDSFYQYIWP